MSGGPGRRARRAGRRRRRAAARRPSCSSISASSPSVSASWRERFAQQPPEPDRLVEQRLAHEPLAVGCGVALGEDQVDDRAHARQPLRQQLAGRDAVGDAGGGDLRLGARQPLAPSSRGSTRKARAISRGAQPAERLERQRDARLRAQRRMAAGEDQPQAVVGELVVVALRQRVLVDGAAVAQRERLEACAGGRRGRGRGAGGRSPAAAPRSSARRRGCAGRRRGATARRPSA